MDCREQHEKNKPLSSGCKQLDQEVSLYFTSHRSQHAEALSYFCVLPYTTQIII